MQCKGCLQTVRIQARELCPEHWVWGYSERSPGWPADENWWRRMSSQLWAAECCVRMGAMWGAGDMGEGVVVSSTRRNSGSGQSGLSTVEHAWGVGEVCGGRVTMFGIPCRFSVGPCKGGSRDRGRRKDGVVDVQWLCGWCWVQKGREVEAPEVWSFVRCEVEDGRKREGLVSEVRRCGGRE